MKSQPPMSGKGFATVYRKRTLIKMDTPHDEYYSEVLLFSLLYNNLKKTYSPSSRHSF